MSDIYKPLVSLSGNDSVDPDTPDVEDPVTPPAEETGGDGSGEESGGSPSGPDGEESGMGDGTGTGGEEGSGSEAPPDSPAPESPPDYGEEILGSLGSVVSLLEDGSGHDGLIDSVRSLVDVMSLYTEAMQSRSVSVPVSGYRGYSYPIHVEYRIFPTALGSETGVSNDYGTPEDFEDGYAFMADSVAQGSLSYFHIRYITDSEGATVYDGTVSPEEPEEPEEPDTFREDVLAALDGISKDLQAVSEDLQTVSANDLEYRTQSLEMQEELLELQHENTQLHYGILAGTLVLCFSLLFTLGYTVAHGFLQRMKVG